MELIRRFWTNHQIGKYGIVDFWIGYKINAKIS